MNRLFNQSLGSASFNKFVLLLIFVVKYNFSFAQPSSIVLDFEGLGDQVSIGNYYSGGSGPNYGISFSSNTLSIISYTAGGRGNFSGQPSGSTVMFFLTGSPIMNVPGGFGTGLSFYYASAASGVVYIYDDVDGTGNLLATANFNATPSPFTVWQTASVSFAGTAKSVVFTGVQNLCGFDDVTFGSLTPGGPSNTPPTISSISNVKTCPNTSTSAIAFIVGDQETTAGNLTVTASSSNTTLVPNANLVLSGSNANRTITVSPVSGQKGSSTITISVADGGGLTTTTSFIVTFDDNTPPTVLTQPVTIFLDAAGKASTTANAINRESYDNCGIGWMVIDKRDFDCSNLGNNSVTLTITDVNGNVNSAKAIVTVLDTIKPTVISRNITVNLDDQGNATITPDQLNNGFFDNCSMNNFTYTVSKTKFDCSNLGDNQVTFSMSDASGNTRSTTAVVRVEDHIAPIIVAKDMKGYLDFNGSYILDWGKFMNGDVSISDNCGVSKKEFSKTSFDCTNIGENDIDIIVTDMSGNVTRKSIKLILEDGTAPELAVIADQTAQAYQKSIQVDLAGLSGANNCAVQKIKSIVAEASNTQIVTGTKVDYVVGKSTAILTLNLAQGVTGSSNIKVTVTDNSGTENGGIDQTTRSFVLTVVPNHAPQVNGTMSEIKVYKGSTQKVTLPKNLFTDPDLGDVLTYSLEGVKGSLVPSWMSINKATSEIEIAPMTVEAIGQHKVTIVATDIIGLTAKYEITITVEIPTAVQIVDGTNLKVYPNPTKGVVNISISNAKEDQMEISVYSAVGSKILSGIYNVYAPIQIDLSGQTNGIYLIKFGGSLKGTIEKIVLNQ